MTIDATDHWGEIDGVGIDFPLDVDEFRSATLTFTVPADPARPLVPDGFELVEVAPGSAMLVLALCDYVRNPWGDYLEVNLGLLVAPTGRPEEAGVYQWRMPVDQEFTCRAGNEVLGLPKSVEDLTASYDDGPDGPTVTFLLRHDGADALRVTVPRAAAAGEPVRSDTITYSVLDGVPTVVPLSIDLPTGVIDPAAVVVELGAGPIAEELRSLGLPAVPDLAAWGEGLGGRFLRPRPV